MTATRARGPLLFVSVFVALLMLSARVQAFPTLHVHSLITLPGSVLNGGNVETDDDEDKSETECGDSTTHTDTETGDSGDTNTDTEDQHDDDNNSSCCATLTDSDETDGADPLQTDSGENDDQDDNDNQQVCVHGVPEFSSGSFAVLLLALPAILIIRRRFSSGANAPLVSLTNGSSGRV